MAESPAQAVSQVASPSCPICKGATSYAVENHHRPFCSARCQRIDLGNWLDERYFVPGAHAHAHPDAGEQAKATSAPAEDADELG